MIVSDFKKKKAKDVFSYTNLNWVVPKDGHDKRFLYVHAC